MTPEIRTERLLLRPPVLADAPVIARLLDNFAVSGNLARVPYPYRLADAKAWLKTRQRDFPPEDTGFAIYLGETGLVGQVGLHTGRTGAPIIGYWLGEPYWGRGIMTEALAAVLDWYFGSGSGDRLVSGVFHFNAASLAIQKKLGFTVTGESSVMCLARGVEVRHIDTELTRPIWQKTSSAARVRS